MVRGRSSRSLTSVVKEKIGRSVRYLRCLYINGRSVGGKVGRTGGPTTAEEL